MAATDGPQQRTTSGPIKAQGPVLGRDRLARLVVVGSFLTLFLLIGTLIALSSSSNPNVSGAADKAFNSILPVLAGWVGTVLAFYFSAASHEQTSASLDKAISQSGGRAVSDTLVSEKMIPASSIFGLRDLKSAGPDKISVPDLQKDFEKKLPNGAAVSRLLFVEGGVFKYVLHVGALNAFIVKSTTPSPGVQPTPSPGAQPTPSPGAQLTFADLLKDQDIYNQISKLVVFVSAGATMGDAKTALDKVNGAQDIIVTGSGNASEPMLGWLSNVDLTKALTAS